MRWMVWLAAGLLGCGGGGGSSDGPGESDDGIPQPQHVEMSPDGSLLAVTKPARSPDAITTIYTDQGALASLPGQVAMFVGNDRILVQYYAVTDGHSQYNGRTVVFDLEGNRIASNALPIEVDTEVWQIDDTRIGRLHEVYDFRTGALLGTYPDATPPQATSGSRDSSGTILSDL